MAKLNEAKIKWKRGVVSPSISSSEEAYTAIFSHLEKTKVLNDMHIKEHSFVVLLDRANQILGIHLLSVGGQVTCVIDQRDVFRAALLSCAVGIILVHNHPSGNMTPSNPDKDITRRIKNAGDVLDIKLFDHIIVDSGKKGSYYSFLDHGQI